MASEIIFGEWWCVTHGTWGAHGPHKIRAPKRKAAKHEAKRRAAARKETFAGLYTSEEEAKAVIESHNRREVTQ
jgi:hypothetical protein